MKNSLILIFIFLVATTFFLQPESMAFFSKLL